MRQILFIHVITLPPEFAPGEVMPDGGGGWGGGGGGGSFRGNGFAPGQSPLPSGPNDPGFGLDFQDFEVVGADQPILYEFAGVTAAATPLQGGYVESVPGTLFLSTQLTGPILGVRIIPGESLGGELEQFSSVPMYFFFTAADGWFGSRFSRGPGGNVFDIAVEPHSVTLTPFIP